MCASGQLFPVLALCLAGRAAPLAGVAVGASGVGARWMALSPAGRLLMLWGEAGLGAGGSHGCSDCARGDQGSGLRTLATGGTMTPGRAPRVHGLPRRLAAPQGRQSAPPFIRAGLRHCLRAAAAQQLWVGPAAGGPEVGVPARPPQASLPPAEPQTQGRVSCGEQGCESPLTADPTHSDPTHSWPHSQ